MARSWNTTGLYKHQRDHVRSGGGRRSKEGGTIVPPLIVANKSFKARAWCSYCDELVNESQIKGDTHKPCGWKLRFMPREKKDE